MDPVFRAALWFYLQDTTSLERVYRVSRQDVGSARQRAAAVAYQVRSLESSARAAGIVGRQSSTYSEVAP